MPATIWWLGVALALGNGRPDPGPAVAPNSAAVIVRLLRPERQFQALLDLFDETPYADPAAALADWRQRTGRHEALGKTGQALIALLNTGMKNEFGLFNDAAIQLGVLPDGATWWALDVPRDDGTLSAIGTAFALTDGRALPPLGEARLDGLDASASVVVATWPDGRVLIASDEATIKRLAAHPGKPEATIPELESGWSARIDPDELPSGTDQGMGRVKTLLDALQCQGLEAQGGLASQRLLLRIEGRYPPAAVVASRPIEVDWLRWIPSDHTAAALVLRLDPSPSGITSAFRLAAAVERALVTGKSNGSDAPRPPPGDLRARVNLAAWVAGLQPERDLWPRLDGITLILGHAVNPGHDQTAWAVALHTRSTEDAERVRQRVVAPLRTLFERWQGPRGEPATATPASEELYAIIEGKTLLLSSSQTLGAACLTFHAKGGCCLDPASLPELLEPGDRRAWPARLGLAWPDRLAVTLGAAPEVIAALAQTPPVVWAGRGTSGHSRDVLVWEGMRRAILAATHQIQDLPVNPEGVVPDE